MSKEIDVFRNTIATVVGEVVRVTSTSREQAYFMSRLLLSKNINRHVMRIPDGKIISTTILFDAENPPGDTAEDLIPLS
jgi:hypothetical protein